MKLRRWWTLTMHNAEIDIRAALWFGLRQSYQMIASVLAVVFVLFAFFFVMLLSVFWFYDVLPPFFRSVSIPMIDIGGGVLFAGMSMALYSMAVKIVYQQPTGLQDLFSYFHVKAIRLAGFTAFYIMASMIGLILCVIPGVYIMLRLSLTPYVIAHTSLPLMEAIRHSIFLTQNMHIRFLWFWLAVFAVRILGTLIVLLVFFLIPSMFFDLGFYGEFALIGWPLTIPIGMLAVSSIYKEISERYSVVAIDR